ncbi:MAG: hypothetical protein ABFS41_17550, partial [Myxococcota bacterium]
MRAGHMIDWQRQAREYLARVRRADTYQRPEPGPAPRPVPGGVHNGPEPMPGPPVTRRSTRDTDERVPVREKLDEARGVLPGIAGDLGDTAGELVGRLQRALEVAEVEAGALAVIFAGTVAVVVTVYVGGKAVSYELAIGGAGPLDQELATRLGQPLLEDFGHRLREIEELSGEARERLGEPARVSRLSRDQRMAYRELVHRPVAELGGSDLERVQRLRELGGMRGPLEPGGAAHKAQRWADYRARSGDWGFERWSSTYDQNMSRAS